MKNNESSFSINITNPNLVMFVNGVNMRSLRSIFFIYRRYRAMKIAMKNSTGCMKFYAVKENYKHFIFVSWWENLEQLMGYYKNPLHKEMMSWLHTHRDEVDFWNEIYQPSRPGVYSGQPHAMAKLFEKISLKERTKEIKND
ncbi:MAG: DUF4188 domain-containing protein [Ignavibacteria bacterium]|nr:DUF4188 domain-containing protein [Ignavibacteria bacterium]